MRFAFLFLLLALAVPIPASAESDKATVNFTSRKKEKPAKPRVITAPAPAPVPAPVPLPPAPAPVLLPQPEAPAPSAETPTPTPVAPVAPVPVVPVSPPETVLLSGEHSHLSAKGMQSHAVVLTPVALPAHSMIVQQVWLDPQDPPRGIALQFNLVSGEEVGVYWEGEEEVFNPTEYEELWYYGLLPELGHWTTLEVLTEDLGLENSQIAGIRFVTYDGRALWDKTVLTHAPPLEETKPS